MKQHTNKIITIIEIILLIFIISASIYLKQTNYLCSIDFSNITPYLEDQTLFIIEYNAHQNTLIILSFVILFIYAVIYHFIKSKYKVDFYDKAYLIYFLIHFLIYFLPKFSVTYNNGVGAELLAVLFSSLTFLQINFINIIPYGCILYIPLIYSFFIKKRSSL